MSTAMRAMPLWMPISYTRWYRKPQSRGVNPVSSIKLELSVPSTTKAVCSTVLCLAFSLCEWLAPSHFSRHCGLAGWNVVDSGQGLSLGPLRVVWQWSTSTHRPMLKPRSMPSSAIATKMKQDNLSSTQSILWHFTERKCAVEVCAANTMSGTAPLQLVVVTDVSMCGMGSERSGCLQ